MVSSINAITDTNGSFKQELEINGYNKELDIDDFMSAQTKIFTYYYNIFEKAGHKTEKSVIGKRSRYNIKNKYIMDIIDEVTTFFYIINNDDGEWIKSPFFRLPPLISETYNSTKNKNISCLFYKSNVSNMTFGNITIG